MNRITEVLNENKLFGKISELAEHRNEEVFVVGGFVRDILLNRDRKDIDILVVGDGIKFAEKLSRQLKAANFSVFKNFGTAHFYHAGFDVEFVGARKESYSSDSRNPLVQPGTFIDDIKRRDFTINTLAVSLNKQDFGRLIDTYGGMADIANRLIKTPLDPETTFNDDPLRIMRAFRFASQLDFEIADVLLESAKKLAERLKIITVERITDEFLKIIASDNPSIGLKLMYQSGVMDVVFPEISNLAGVDQRKDFHHKDVFLHTLQVLDNISEKTDNIWLRFAALMHDIAKPQTKRFDEKIGWTFHGHEEVGARMMKRIFRRMKLPMNRLNYVEKLVRLHLRPIALVDSKVTDSAIRRLVVQAGEDLDDLITLCRADITSKNRAKKERYLNNYEIIMRKVKEVEEKDKLRAFQSPVRGDEIMSVCGIPPSRTVGKIKTAIEEAILDGKIKNDYEEAYQYLLQIKDRYLSENS